MDAPSSIEPFVHRKIIVLHQDSPVAQAARVMAERGIGCILVADHESHIVGIVTARDLVGRVLGESKLPETPIGSIMSTQVVSIPESASVEDVVRIMEEYGIRRVPVIRTVHRNLQKCVGLVTLEDLIASRSIDFGEVIRIVRAQIQRRARVLPSVLGEDRFFRTLSERIREKVPLTDVQVQHLTRTVLGALVRRLHHTGAMHLVAQLPRKLQTELATQPPGPDPTIHAARVSNEIATRFHLDDALADSVLVRFCSTLGDLIDSHELEQVKAQLPEDLRALFSGGQVSGARKMKAV